MSYSDWGVALWKALVFGQRLNLMTPCPSMDFQYYVQSLLNQEVTKTPVTHASAFKAGPGGGLTPAIWSRLEIIKPLLHMISGPQFCVYT